MISEIKSKRQREASKTSGPISGLMRLQTELEVNDVFRLEKLIKGCGKTKLEVDLLTFTCRDASCDGDASEEAQDLVIELAEQQVGIVYSAELPRPTSRATRT